MDVGWHGVAGIFDCDPPQIADAEHVRLCHRERGIVEIEALVVQSLDKVSIIQPSIKLQQLGTCLWDVHPTPNFFVEDNFAGWPKISAKVCVRFDRGAVCMKGVRARCQQSALISSPNGVVTSS